MLIVRPVSRHDLHLLEPQVELMRFFGGLRNHQVLFLPAPSVLQETTLLAGRIHTVCDQTAVEVLPREPEGGWPVACNMHFMQAVEILEKRGNTLPWMWMELDAWFMTGGSPDRLEQQYNQIGSPFLGFLRETKEVLKDAKTGAPVDDGRYMVGSLGIYPPNYKQISSLYKEVGFIGRPGNVGFDIRTRWEVIRAGATHCPSMEHHSRTVNYHRDPTGTIVCHDEGLRGEGQFVYGGPVSKNCLYLHGCVDGSLARLLMGDVTQAPEVGKTAPEGLSGQSGMPVTDFEDLEKALEIAKKAAGLDVPQTPQSPEMPFGLFKRLCEFLGIPEDQRTAKWDQLVAKPSKIQTEQQEQEEDLTSTASPKPALNLTSLRKAVETAEGAVDPGSLAADFGVAKNRIKDLIALPDSGLVQDGRWVRLAEPVPA